VNKDANVHQNNDIKQGVIRYVIQNILFILLQAVCLFLSAGSLVWGYAWIYLGVVTINQALAVIVLIHTNPALLGERARIQDDIKRWDRPLAGYMALYGVWFILIVAGLDQRFGWSSQVSVWVQIFALVLMGLGSGLTIWALSANKYFSGYMRIQKERGHTVAKTGPYQFVRHPGYLGAIIFYLSTPLLLGSLWAYIPVGFYVIVVLIRTSLEDRALQQELDGYQVYTKVVRYRLVPGIW
jgi:protein-S-isoprenylcysteine O-methyltransferase Ste14